MFEIVYKEVQWSVWGSYQTICGPFSRMLNGILEDDNINRHPPSIKHFTNNWPCHWSRLFLLTMNFQIILEMYKQEAKKGKHILRLSTISTIMYSEILYCISELFSILTRVYQQITGNVKFLKYIYFTPTRPSDWNPYDQGVTSQTFRRRSLSKTGSLCDLSPWIHTWLDLAKNNNIIINNKNNSACKGPWVLYPYQVSSKSIKIFRKNGSMCVPLHLVYMHQSTSDPVWISSKILSLNNINAKPLFRIYFEMSKIAKSIIRYCQKCIIIWLRNENKINNTSFHILPDHCYAFCLLLNPFWSEGNSQRRVATATYFCLVPDPPLGGSGRKTTSIVRENEHFFATKFYQNPSSGSCWSASRAPGLTSGLQGSVNVHRGALLLVPQWQCISSFVFYIGNVKCWRTDDWRCVITIVYFGLWLRCTKTNQAKKIKF